VVTLQGSEKKQGKLVSVNEQGIVVGEEGIPFQSILETFVKSPW
jgi:hypothetical protein